METELLRARIRRAEPLRHASRPQTSRRAELRDFLEKVIVRIEEERDALSEGIDVKTCVDCRLHIRARVREREGDLLYRGRCRLPAVITADRNRGPRGQLA